MSYMILTYGSYDVPNDVYDIETEEDAIDTLRQMVEEWCDDHGLDAYEDTDYSSDDDCFIYGEEEEGACIIALYHIPLIETEAAQYLWDAKVEMERAYFASEDYKWLLSDCCVAEHTIEAQNLIDKAMEELIGGWKYEEE